jgi:hypothetical protein
MSPVLASASEFGAVGFLHQESDDHMIHLGLGNGHGARLFKFWSAVGGKAEVYNESSPSAV